MDRTHDAGPRRSNAYNIFILVLTVYSLVLMVLLLLPLDSATLELLGVYDNVVCVLFLFDFAMNLVQAPSKKAYFVNQRGWLDLLGSLPSFGFFRASGLLRLARLSRLARIARLLHGQQKRELVNDVIRNRSQYALSITVMAAMLVLTLAAGFVLQLESQAPNGNIKTGNDALWWSLVTITTVGYGDFFPTTPGGRVAAMFVMVAGVGIIGALASILASILIPPPADDQAPVADRELDVVRLMQTVQQEQQSAKAELVALRALVERAIVEIESRRS
jgi:voltage-gated potassium channel